MLLSNQQGGGQHQSQHQQQQQQQPPQQPIPLVYQNDAMAIHLHRDLPQHAILHKLGPECGRLSSTFQLKHMNSGSIMIVKVMTLDIKIVGIGSGGGGGGMHHSSSSSLHSSNSSNHSGNNHSKREYASITQEELLAQEQELKRILLAVSSDDEDEDQKMNDNGKNDFSHAILPYQSWYISPFVIHQSTATINNTTNSSNSKTSTSNTIPTRTLTKMASPAYLTSSSDNSNNNNNNTNNTSTSSTPQSQSYIIQKRPIYLFRPYTYTTLSIKIITRPFLSNVEKLYICHQILLAVQELHAKKLAHGHLTCENIGLTSFHSVYLLDVMPNNNPYNNNENNNNRAVRPLLIPDDDPSDWIYYFQERMTNKSGNTSSGISNGGGGGGGANDASSNITTNGDQGDVNTSMDDNNKNNNGSGNGTSSTTTTTTTAAAAGNNNNSSGGSGSKTNSGGDDKKCYIAPERFVSKSTPLSSLPTKLTPAMDIFSLGCVLMQLFLNGETAMDLGDLMEYRRINGDISKHSTLGKKLNKIESGKMRAAVRNMLHLDPTKRLSASEYLKRLKATNTTASSSSSNTSGTDSKVKGQKANSSGGTANSKGGTTTTTIAPFPKCHESVYIPFMKKIRCQILSPDARIALCALYYEKIIQETVGIADTKGGAYFRKIVGPTAVKYLSPSNQNDINDNGDTKATEDDLLFTTLEEFVPSQSMTVMATPSSDALIIFVQFILATIRHTQRPSSKIVGLQLLGRLAMYSNDEVRLQRIVPTIISVLNDSDATVRAMTTNILTAVVSCIDHFPPSDAQVFPQYLFKKISPLMNDTSLVVRIAFTESIAKLAETALRFLDTCHAIKLYETVEGATSDQMRNTGNQSKEEEANDYSTSTALIRNDYDKYLLELQETIAKWVISITTDTSNYASALKQALLKDIARLCNFFGHDGTMTCILPQVLAFLNHRRDWQLRAALCEQLPSICTMIGRAATEQFVVPCVETALADEEERVVASALVCLASLVEMGLITRRMLLGARSKNKKEGAAGIIQQYATLLVDPSDNVRYAASFFIAACCRSVRFPDDEVFLMPIIKPFLRYDVQRSRLQTSDAVLACLVQPLPSTKDPSSETVMPDNEIRIVNDPIERVHKAAFSCFVQNQKFAELLAKPLPPWYDELKRVSSTNSELESDIAALRNLSILSQVYGVSINQPSHEISQRYLHSNFLLSDPRLDLIQTNTYSETNLRHLLSDPISYSFVASTKGEWGSEVLLDPALIEISQDVSKLVSLELPPKAPKLGSLRNSDGRIYSSHTPKRTYRRSPNDQPNQTEWKPKFDILTCSSAPNEHGGPVCRLSVAQDQSFFVSASHDGTCKVWESLQIIKSAGDLSSSLTYEDHSIRNGDISKTGTRVNDLCIIENSHSVASGDSNGAVHVWRVDTFCKNSTTSNELGFSSKTSGVSGHTVLRKVDPCEGEILAVSHFNTSTASIVAYATHRGIHTWDLRSAKEPFYLNFQPEYGHLTSIAIGDDRNWVVAGSNRGHLALWDIRFQKLVKLWQHESAAPVNRLETFTSLHSSDGEIKPNVMVACGLNEANIFDVSRGNTSHCFRVLAPSLCYTDQSALPDNIKSFPTFRDIAVGSEIKRRTQSMGNIIGSVINQRRSPPEPSIQSFVGKIGGSGENFLITAGSDALIHYWNLSSASKCFAVSGLSSAMSRPIYTLSQSASSERLFFCRQNPQPTANEIPSSNISKAMHKGPTRPDNRHIDSILDIKTMDYPGGLLSCSRDSTVKFWS